MVRSNKTFSLLVEEIASAKEIFEPKEIILSLRNEGINEVRLIQVQERSRGNLV
jgi:hypothetical protein